MMQIMLPTGLDIANLRKRIHLTQEVFSRKLGISRSHLAKVESKHSKPLSHRLCAALERISASYGTDKTKIRQIRVISWAQAGVGADFEELPMDWQHTIPTDCPDNDAFALELKGDSMEPKYSTGDILILMPGNEPHIGSLVVARFASGDVMFKLYNPNTPASDKVTLTSLNTAYPPIVSPKHDLLWVYPVYRVIKDTWEGLRA